MKILITGANSDMAADLIKILTDFEIFACSRRHDEILKKENLKSFYLDLTSSSDFKKLQEEMGEVKFDVVVNFAGVAVTSPVVNLSDKELQKQLDINVCGLLRLLKFVYPKLKPNSRVINVSSMAANGIFPFISPYCLSKAAADILLNSFEIETGIKTVSIRPGVVRTKFWEYCIEKNVENFENFNGEFKEAGEFLLQNARKNSSRGLYAHQVANVIKKAILAKNPKGIYNIGLDSKIASLSKLLPQRFLNKMISRILKKRVKEFKNAG